MKMRSMFGAATVVALVAVGCGGSGTPSEGEGSGGESTPLAADVCNDIAEKLAKLRLEITRCDPVATVLQCQIMVDDICCPVTANGGPIEEFKELVAAYKEAGCTAICPAVVCREKPTERCLLSGHCAQL